MTLYSIHKMFYIYYKVLMFTTLLHTTKPYSMVQNFTAHHTPLQLYNAPQNCMTTQLYNITTHFFTTYHRTLQHTTELQLYNIQTFTTNFTTQFIPLMYNFTTYILLHNKALRHTTKVYNVTTHHTTTTNLPNITKLYNCSTYYTMLSLYNILQNFTLTITFLNLVQ